MNLNLLNHAMLTQVLLELQNGNFERCRQLGLGIHDLRLLQSLPQTTLTRLSSSRVSWVKFKVDSDMLKQLAEQAERDVEQERLANRALVLGASTEMMYQYFGLSHSDTAARRRILQIEARRGRPTQINEAQEHAIWNRWCELHQDNGSLEVLDALMMLAEEQNISLTVIWHQISLYRDT